MFSYYGAKRRLAKYYPAPQYDTIIEPFAGSGAYAYQYWNRRIILNDGYKTVINIYKYLQNVTIDKILDLPEIANGECIRDKYSFLHKIERDLIGFSINNASAMPKHTAGTGNHNSWQRDKINIAANLNKIKHWQLVNGDYQCLANIEATWFIDPPYQHNKYPYSYQKINYAELAAWCQSRKGQVIVCENEGANWLPFRPFRELSGQRKKTKELIWTNG